MIFAALIESSSSLPTDASTLESAISALERDIRALENSSVPWEQWLPYFTGVVAFGVAMEFWLIWRERGGEMKAWARGTIRSPERPSTTKFAVAIVSLLLIAGGIAGELGINIKITSINGKLRTRNAELRSKSDQLVAVLGEEAARLQQDAAKERLARVKIEAAVAWRQLSEQQKRDIGNTVQRFSSSAVASVWFNASSTEAELFGDDIAEALQRGHIIVQPPSGVMEMRESSKFGEPIKRALTGVVIQSTKHDPARKLAALVVAELNRLGFDAIRQTDPPFDDKPLSQIWINVEPRPKGPQGEYKPQREGEATAKNTNSKHLN